jgi:hypothetical protein
MKLLAWDPTKKKQVLCGELIGDTLFRWVEPKHFMRVVGGYGIQEIAFQEIVKRGVKKIVLKETHTNQRWEATIDEWKEHCHIADYGHGKQRFMSTKYMHTHKLPPQEVR